jgi:hypothetical protein
MLEVLTLDEPLRRHTLYITNSERQCCHVDRTVPSFSWSPVLPVSTVLSTTGNAIPCERGNIALTLTADNVATYRLVST